MGADVETSGPIRVEGLKQLRKELKAAGVGYAELKGVGLQAATIVSQAAKPIAPQVTGALAGSIRPAGQAKGAVVRAGSAAVPYAGPIHFGWPAHHIEPHPFLYEAADARVDEVRDLYQQRVQDISDTVKGAS